MNLGPMEIVAILVVALIVFGPKRLPEISRQVGAAIRELRKVQDTVRAELREAMAEPTPAGPEAEAAARAELTGPDLPAPAPDVSADTPAPPRTFS